jgi:hypothetical protein
LQVDDGLSGVPVAGTARDRADEAQRPVERLLGRQDRPDERFGGDEDDGAGGSLCLQL